MYTMRMSRVNVYIPDDLAAAAREAGLNVSSLTQKAIRSALQSQATNQWLDVLPGPQGVTTAAVAEAIKGAKDDLERRD